MSTQRSIYRFALPASAFTAALITSGIAHGADLTLTKAFLDARNGFVDFKQIDHSLQPGDQVLLEGHTRPSLLLVNLVYGDPGNPIVVTNTGAAPFVIDDVGATRSNGIKIWGAQHVVFKGTPLDGSPYGIRVLNASSVGIDVDYNNYQQGRIAGDFEDTIDLVIADLEIAHAGFAGIQAKYEMSEPFPIAVPLLDGLEIRNTYIHDVEGEGMYIGWTSDGHPDVANVSIHGNLIEEAGWDGIQLNRSRGQNSIHNNVIDGYATMSFTASGGAFGAQNEGISVSGAKTDIYGNLVRASNEYSGSSLFFSMFEPSSVHNNVFIHGGFGSTKPEAMLYIRQISSGRLAAPSSATLELVNNTLVQPDTSGVELLGGVTRPVNIINNVIVEPLNGPYVHQQSAQSPVTLTTNLFASNLAAAGFAGATDYRPGADSALVDAGTDASDLGVSTDADGVARPQGAAYDIGAYERATDSELVIITPAAWGTATGSAYCAALGAFDAQPTWNPATSAPDGDQGTPHEDTGTAYPSRFWYVDLGPDWARVRITELWTRYRPFSGGSYAGFASSWWDDDVDTVNDGVAAAGVNFATAQALPQVGTQQWARDRSFTAPVTPAGRYLVFSTGATPTNRANEFAFVGYR